MKFKLTKRALKNAKSLDATYNNPEEKDAKLKGYEWGSKVLDS